MKDETKDGELILHDAGELPAIIQRGGIETVVERIESEVGAEVIDASTRKGREAAKSLAYKVSRTKTAIDNAGKKLTEEWRAKIDAVNGQRRIATERLDRLRDDVRKPVIEWEDREAQRVAAHQGALQKIADSASDWSEPPEKIAEVIADLEAMTIDETWEEFEELAREAMDSALARHRRTLEMAEARVAQARELERLRREKAEHEQREANEARAREAEERKAREARELSERQKSEADDLVSQIKDLGELRLNGHQIGVSIALHELVLRLPAVIEKVGPHRDSVELARVVAVQKVRERKAEEMAAAEDAKRQEEAARQERQEKREAEIKAELDAARAKASELEAERQAAMAAEETAAESKRKNSAANRRKAQARITSAIEALDDQTPKGIAAALVSGKIPQVTVEL